jgi:hypothetical protein
MKLSGLTILLIGVSVAIIALSFGFFQHWMPNTTETGYWVNYKAQLETEIGKRAQAQRRVDDTKKFVEERAEQWRGVVAQKTPPTSVERGGINLAVNGWQLTVDTQRFRNSIQRDFNLWVKKGGVVVVNGPSVPMVDAFTASNILSGFYNYPAVPFPVVMVDFGQVEVRGTYEQIAANVRSWRNMPNYLVVADGLEIGGTSPVLTGRYKLSMVAYIRGKEIFPAVPEGAGGGQAPGPGGGGGPAPTSGTSRGGGGRGPAAAG